MTHRITPAEITARRMLMIECKRSQDAAMVGQMERDIAKLREALEEIDRTAGPYCIDLGGIARAALEDTQ